MTRKEKYKAYREMIKLESEIEEMFYNLENELEEPKKETYIVLVEVVD